MVKLSVSTPLSSEMVIRISWPLLVPFILSERVNTHLSSHFPYTSEVASLLTMPGIPLTSIGVLPIAISNLSVSDKALASTSLLLFICLIRSSKIVMLSGDVAKLSEKDFSVSGLEIVGVPDLVTSVISLQPVQQLHVLQSYSGNFPRKHWIE